MTVRITRVSPLDSPDQRTEAALRSLRREIADVATGVTGPKGDKGDPGDGADPDWTYYVTLWDTPPTFNSSITGGDVYDYTLGAVTRYRFVPTTYDASQDAFYSGFSSPTLSGLIVARDTV